MTEGNAGSVRESVARRGGWAGEAGIERMESEIVGWSGADGDKEESLTESETQQRTADASARAKNMGPHSDVRRRERCDEQRRDVRMERKTMREMEGASGSRERR